MLFLFAVHQKIPLINVASDLWAVAFRANFIVFWAHCMTNQLRASRLDAVQHRAIHGLNACTNLIQNLSEENQLSAQRAALKHVSAGILTIEESAQYLGIGGVKGTSSNGGTKGTADALQALSSAGAENTAKLLAFARAAWLSEEMLIVDLGPKTKQLQLSALFKRLGRMPLLNSEQPLNADVLPIHATHLHACIECKRVANAYATDSSCKVGQTFNEMGVSSSMLCTECADGRRGETHIRCAKRSSAALRTAVTFEEQMESREVESGPLKPNEVKTMLSHQGGCSTASSSDSGIAARIRRDAKNALEQRATALACGEQPMLSVPIVGRAIRIWNEWYALCSLCGAMLRVLPHNRFGVEICCLKCDAQMLGIDKQTAPERAIHMCRYCNKVDTERTATRWKVIKAPLDVSGDNKTTPPPLRTVMYCPTHWRSWLTAAHRVLQTRVILSHIAHNAKPIFSTDNNWKRRTADELGFEAVQRGRKKKRSKNKASNGDESE